MKNVFCFILKAPFVFVLTVLVTYENGLIKKLRLISKFITSSTAKQIITIPIWANISRSKANQTMKNISSKIMHKMKQGEHLQTYFFQRKKALNEEKKVVSTLAGRYFGSP